MPERIPNGVAKNVVFRAISSADHFTPATGNTIAITIRKWGGAFGNPAAGATNATEIASGFYYFSLGTGDCTTAGPLAWRGAGTGVDDVGDVYEVVAATNAGFTGIPAAVAGASGGLIINGSNTGAVTLNGLTTGALVSSSYAISGTLSVGGTSTFAAFTTAAFTTAAFTPSSISVSGAVSATNAANDIRGILLQATQTGVTIPTVTTLTTAAKSYENGAIWIDTIDGVAGTAVGTNGMATTPVKAITDVATLIASTKLRKVEVAIGSTITFAATHANESFLGEKWTLALGSQAITGSYFKGATVSGIGTGAGTQWFECTVGTVTLPTTQLTSCSLTGTFTTGATGTYIFNNCVTAQANNWVLDFDALGASVVVLWNFSGSVSPVNMAAGDALVFCGTGALAIQASCLAGTVYVRGMVEVTGSAAFVSAGGSYIDSARWGEDQSLATVTNVGTVNGNVLGTVAQVNALAANVITAASMNADASAEIVTALLATAVDGTTTVAVSIRLQNAALGGKASGLGTGTAIYRDLADTKDRMTASVDVDGNRSAVTRVLT